ncbi:unnamed protein product, partial [Sphenostylis stenocarpa]
MSQKYFEAKDSDVIVASFPKSGTTWLKAITFAIVNRQSFSSIENHPLLETNPHELVPAVEFMYRGDVDCPTTEPRVFGTHTPFPSLPKSIMDSNCKIIYICRNPFDTFVSAWTYFNKIKLEPLSALQKEEAFEMFCNGVIEFGPWWSHMLGYWKQSKVTPDKVLFLKYEDLKEDANFHVKRVAEFLGFPFTEEEESNSVIENIVKLCSFSNMKDLEVNKSGVVYRFLEKKYFFRKAEIGDWLELAIALTMSPFKSYGKVDESEQVMLEVRRRTRKRITIIALSTIVLIGVVCAAVFGTVAHNNNNNNNSNDGENASSISNSVKDVCDVTLYKDACYSSLGSLAESGQVRPEDLFLLSIKVALGEASKAAEYFSQKVGFSGFNVDNRTMEGFKNCNDLLGLAIDHLNSSLASGGKFSLLDTLEDLRTWLSAA